LPSRVPLQHALMSKNVPSMTETLPLKLVLVGRPNSGKSSLYNTLTSGKAHVGNFPGITVDILEGECGLPDAARTRVMAYDLPGLYTLSESVDPETDEGVARRFIESSKDTDCILLHVIDGTQLALGLKLTSDLRKHGKPVIVVVSQHDRMQALGQSLDVEALSTALGLPVVLVTGKSKDARGPVLREVLLHQKDSPDKREIDMRALAKTVVTQAARAHTDTTSSKLDAWMLHPLLGPLLFVAIMTLAFGSVFFIAEPATAIIDGFLGKVGELITSKFGTGKAVSFVVDGILGGAGTVFAFAPQIILLSVIMEALDASGYLARGAFIVDRVFRSMGLSGRSFLPLLMGHACAVPAISATRIIRDPKERLATILVLPLMTCSARIPTYALVLSTFFSSKGVWFRALAFVALYALGAALGLLAALVLRKSAVKGKSLPLVLEIPPYRMPEFKVLASKGLLAARRFFKDVGSTILLVTLGLWMLLNVSLPGARSPSNEPAIEHSIAATIGRTLEPITAAAGFDWRINVALLGSFGARELMVGTMGVIVGIENAADDMPTLAEKLRTAQKPDGTPRYTTRTGLALLAFFLFACQCVSTVAAIRRETKSLAWPAFVLGYTYALAYAAAVIVYQTAGFFGVT
jgi:ferrous iron transport protein B